MPVEGEADRYEHRHHIDGVPHCPECGGMLWPPEYTGKVVGEDGEVIDDILEADASKVHFHVECYDKRFNGGSEAHEPTIRSENDERNRNPPKSV